jgi:hypothetical protein
MSPKGWGNGRFKNDYKISILEKNLICILAEVLEN